MKMNKLKALLKNDLVAFGSWLTLGDTGIAEIMAQNGCDFLTIDLEHSAINIHQTQELIRIIELSGSIPLVRISKNDTVEIKRVMDAGAYGIIVPNVESKTEAENIVASMYYAPRGHRGVGLSRAQTYGMNFSHYQNWLQEEALVILQIENKKALDNIHSILSVNHIDAIVFGPYDMSSSLGVTGQLNHPLVLEAEEIVLQACLEHKVVAGIHVVHPNDEEVKKRVNLGYRLIAYGADMIFLADKVKTHFTNLKTFL